MDIFLHCMLVLLMVRSRLSLLIPREVPGDAALEGARGLVLRFPSVAEDAIRRALLADDDPKELNYCARTDDDTWISMFCKDHRLGNALVIYWNLRAYAAPHKLDFFMESNRTDLVSKFPTTVKEKDVKIYPTHLELYKHLKQAVSACWFCMFPHENMYAPWLIMGDVILEGTRSVVKRVIESSPNATKLATSWAQRPNWAVFHFRCGLDMLRQARMGLLPHRFIAKWIPRGTTTLLIVALVPDTEARCSAVLNDLMDFLCRREGIVVQHQQASVEDDWLTLATAPVLICSPLTFCLTVAMGNPNHVYFPVNGQNMIVPADGETISGAQVLRSPNFRWVETDFIPAPLAFENEKNTSWKTLQEYLHSDDCTEEQRQPCVAIGGSTWETVRRIQS